MMRFANSLFVAAVILLAVSAQSAQAQSCQTLLNDLVAHAATVNGNDNYVTFQMTGNRESSDWAQYATGTLRYYPGRFNGLYYIFPRFFGDGTQYFSDRIWSEPAPPGGLFGTPHPFNPHATDKLRIGFNLGLLATYGNLTYTLLSWGNASATVTPQCQGNYMYAFLNDQMLTFTFKKVSQPPIH